MQTINILTDTQLNSNNVCAPILLVARKNGEIEEETTEEGYTLKFRCRQEVLEDVMDRLNAVKESIVPVELDLNKEFPAPYGNISF